MKVAILSESPADEAGVRILVEAVLGWSIEPVGLRARPGGWTALLKVLPAMIKHLHYRRPADGLVVVLDSNKSVLHTGPLDELCAEADKCRLCQVRSLLAEVRASLRTLDGYGPVRTAVGLAVPAIEAWYLCGKNPNVSEGAWARAMKSGEYPYSKREMKRQVYGTDRPGLDLERDLAVEESSRLAREICLLEGKFPLGFGTMARDLRGWAPA